MTTTRDARTGGAIAAGHPLSARAGAEVLARGGNACDALVAAVLASWVCEPTVSGACGGGFLLHRSAAGRVDLLDFFAAAPGLGLDAAGAADGELRGRVRHGRAAVPHRRRLGAPCPAPPPVSAPRTASSDRCRGPSWSRRRRRWPARASSRRRRTRAWTRSCVPVVTLTPEARADLGARRPRADARARPCASRRSPTRSTGSPRRAPTISTAGELADAVVAFSDEAGAALTARDLASYRVIRRRPVEVPFRGYRVRTNAPPSSGGLLLAYGLALHDRLPSADDPLAARGGALARGDPARGRGAAWARAGAGAVPQRRAPAARRPVAGARPGAAAGRPARRAAAGGRTRPRRAARATSRWSTRRATPWR